VLGGSRRRPGPGSHVEATDRRIRSVGRSVPARGRPRPRRVTPRARAPCAGPVAG